MLDSGMVGKSVTAGTGRAIENEGAPIALTATLTANLPKRNNGQARRLTWAGTGNQWHSSPTVKNVNAGEQIQFDNVPATNSTGWRLDGAVPDLGSTGHVFTYTLMVSGRLGAKTIQLLSITFVLSESDPDTIDVDTLLEAGSTTGATISVVDIWSAQIAAAQAAAGDAQDAADAAAASAAAASANTDANFADKVANGTLTKAALNAAYAARGAVLATASGDVTATPNKYLPVDASGAARTITLPTGASVGDVLTIEKRDSSRNAVTVSGTIRGAAGTLTLTSQYQTVSFTAESASSWVPTGDHRTKTALDAAYGAFTLVTLFGVKTTNDSTTNTPLFQAAIDSLAATGGTVFVPAGTFNVGNVTFPPNVNLAGPGTLNGAQVTFGSGVRQEYNSTVTGITFTGTRTAGYCPIRIKAVRRLRITQCTIRGADKAVYVEPTVGLAQHDNSMIDIEHNTFEEVNYAWYVDKDAGAGWDVTADSHFIGNIINRAYIRHVHIEAIDGVDISNNRMFFLSYNTTSGEVVNKRQNIYIAGLCDWVKITGNDLFEAGWEGIRLDNAQHAVIVGNNVAWPGQLQPSDAISLSGNVASYWTVAGNVFSRYTRHAMSLNVAFAQVRIGPNVCEYDPSVSQYIGVTYGQPALSSFTHYRYYSPDGVAGTVNLGDQPNPINGFNDKFANRNGTVARRSLARWAQESAAFRAVTTSGSTPQKAVELYDYNGGISSYSGTIEINIRRSDSSGTREAYYVLLVSKVNDGSATTAISVLASTGLTAGANAADPSFTFTISSDQVKITPVGSTSGSFSVWAIARGNLLIA
ncbi:right-handed parallel beta-helix repeat-containing protein [Nocardioides sp. AN3]